MAEAKNITTVTMLDGRIVDFPGKRKLQQTSTIGEDGSVVVKLDFINGETRIFTIPPELLHKFAAHGAEQKLGDAIAGLDNIDDGVEAVDGLIDRLNAGEWHAGDWIGINFDDGSALMAFRLRDGNGGALWSSASIHQANGRSEILPAEAVAFEPLRDWRSPRTGITYPVEWRFRLGRRELLLQPLMDDQELDSRRSTGAIYWEGAIRLSEGGQEVGRGYLEMTGCGEKIRLG